MPIAGYESTEVPEYGRKSGDAKSAGANLSSLPHSSIGECGPGGAAPSCDVQTGTGSSARKALRARFSRLFTVPTGMPIASAISSYERSSTSRITNGTR